MYIWYSLIGPELLYNSLSLGSGLADIHNEDGGECSPPRGSTAGRRVWNRHQLVQQVSHLFLLANGLHAISLLVSSAMYYNIKVHYYILIGMIKQHVREYGTAISLFSRLVI